MWLSVYEAADGKMSEECFSDMVEASMEAPLVKGSFKGKAKTAFTLEAQQKRADNARWSNALSDSPFNWNTEVILGRDTDEYTSIIIDAVFALLGARRACSIWCLICVRWILSLWNGWAVCCIVPKPLPQEEIAVIFISAGRILNGIGKNRVVWKMKRDEKEKISADVWRCSCICGGYH